MLSSFSSSRSPDTLSQLSFSSPPASRRLRSRSLFALAVLLLSASFLGFPAAAQLLHSAGPAPDEAAPDSTLPANIPQELRLGANYLIGNGVPRDPALSAWWYRRAADHGDPGAQNQLGYFYVWGIGVQQDFSEAVRWFMRAAGAGLQQAKLNLAVMYLRGRGVSRDPAFAVDLLIQLAEKGNCRAQDYLGILYYNGADVPQDHALADRWLGKSAAAKCPEGEYSMARLDSIGPGHFHDPALAAKLFRHSAKAGYVPSMQALALLLLAHPEIPQHPGEALSLLERAAEAGTWRSSEALGLLARDGGAGLAPDPVAAYRWFTIAERQGGPDARQDLQPDLVHGRQILSPQQQEQQEQLAGAWLHRHPNFDLFVEEGRGHGVFPDAEVFAGQPRLDSSSPASPSPVTTTQPAAEP